jgi:hypothetical protein
MRVLVFTLISLILLISAPFPITELDGGGSVYVNNGESSNDCGSEYPYDVMTCILAPSYRSTLFIGEEVQITWDSNDDHVSIWFSPLGHNPSDGTCEGDLHLIAENVTERTFLWVVPDAPSDYLACALIEDMNGTYHQTSGIWRIKSQMSLTSGVGTRICTGFYHEIWEKHVSCIYSDLLRPAPSTRELRIVLMGWPDEMESYTSNISEYVSLESSDISFWNQNGLSIDQFQVTGTRKHTFGTTYAGIFLTNLTTPNRDTMSKLCEQLCSRYPRRIPIDMDDGDAPPSSEIMGWYGDDFVDPNGWWISLSLNLTRISPNYPNLSEVVTYRLIILINNVDCSVEHLGTDTDGDHICDHDDAFPDDKSEWSDTDGDGVGDNSDAFPQLSFLSKYSTVTTPILSLVLITIVAFGTRRLYRLFTMKIARDIRSEFDNDLSSAPGDEIQAIVEKQWTDEQGNTWRKMSDDRTLWWNGNDWQDV